MRVNIGDLEGAIADFNSNSPQSTGCLSLIIIEVSLAENKAILMAQSLTIATALYLNPQFADAYYSRGNARSKGDLEGRLPTIMKRFV